MRNFSVWKILASGLVLITLLFNVAGANEDPASPTPHVVFLISEDPDNYEATRTIPIFAKMLEREYSIKATVLLGEGRREAFHFPGLAAISEADLIVVFCRRVALPHAQMQMIKGFLKQGKPLVGIRTANHAFSVTGAVAEGHEAWPAFVADILGCENRGYGPQESGVDVTLVPSESKHPIIRKIEPAQWHSEGSIYKVAPLLDEKARVLAKGSANDNVEPVAWTRITNDKSRVFYTSLGYPSDFDKPQVEALMTNGIFWALNMKRAKLIKRK